MIRGLFSDVAPSAPCVADDTTICLQGGRFRVEVNWTKPTGQVGQGHVVPFGSDDSGLFYFFNPDNWEMLIKVLNACQPEVGNHYWVFFAATTNVEFTLTVTDTERSVSKTYFNPQGHSADAVTDTAAFATCP